MSTPIQWTDETWNPIVGCTKVSAGCAHCYAERHAVRLAGNPLPAIAEAYAGLTDDRGRWTGRVRLVERALTRPLRWRKPRRVFVNSMSDLFHEQVPDEWIDRIFAVMALCPQHAFQILTKRPERMAAYLQPAVRPKALPDARTGSLHGGPFTEAYRASREYAVGTHIGETAAWGAGAEFRQFVDAEEMAGRLAVFKTPAFKRWNTRRHRILDEFYRQAEDHWPLPNVWLGTSIEDQATADQRIPHLLKCPAAVRFVSCEPLLGPVDLTEWCSWDDTSQMYRWTKCSHCGVVGDSWDPCPGCGSDEEHNPAPPLDWVIVGGESGPGARPMHPAWARGLRDQCQTAGVPFFFKQWGAWLPDCLCGGKHRCRTTARPEPPGGGIMFRCGARSPHQHKLDEREWRQMPKGSDQ